MVILVTSYYNDVDNARRAELEYCLERNCRNKYIDRIIIVTEDNCEIIQEKVSIVNISERPSFARIIEIANRELCDSDLVILANADIVIPTRSVLQMQATVKNNAALALSRWEVTNGGRLKLYSTNSSQDCWAFRGKIHVEGANYYLGSWACDNRFAYDIANSGYKIKNYALDIITVHVHESTHRNYTRDGSSQHNIKYLVPKANAGIVSILTDASKNGIRDYRIAYLLFVLRYNLTRYARRVAGRFSPLWLKILYVKMQNSFPVVEISDDNIIGELL